MIAIDTSALMAIVLGEDGADGCMDAIRAASGIAISSVTLTEALVVADRRGVGGPMRSLIDRFDLVVFPATADTARQVAQAYARWGKGVHRARLNFADCFSYVLATQNNIGLLYQGNDFSQTDVVSILPR